MKELQTKLATMIDINLSLPIFLLRTKQMEKKTRDDH